MDNYYASKLLPLIKEAGVAAIANPLINIVIQGRHDSYPKRRGLTRVPEMLAHGIPIAFGHDCVMDPWYSLGTGDMLDVTHMAIHVAHMTGLDAMRACFDAITSTPAAILHLEGYGLAPGCFADLVVLDAADPIDAIRTRTVRMHVLRRGKVIASAPPRRSSLHLPGRPAEVGFSRPTPD
jgi:cytosine deaminase